MSSFRTPLLRRGDQMPDQTGFVDKFGGLPWGLPPDRWPLCHACRKPMILLAQVAHHTGRLELGRDGRTLHVFQCNHDPGMCETWTAASGANACLILEAEHLVSGLTPLPTPDTSVETEVRVVGWTEGDEDAEEPAMATKFGGLPSWIQGDDEGPAAPWRWVAQFDWQHRLEDGTLCDAANYGDAGMAYIFVNTAAATPEAVMFWQCG